MDENENYFVRVLKKNTIYPGAIRFDLVKIQGKLIYKEKFWINKQQFNFVFFKDCEELCPIEQFVELTSDKFVNDYGTACQEK